MSEETLSNELETLLDDMLMQAEQLINEEKEIRPTIWQACEQMAGDEMLKRALKGNLLDFDAANAERERLTRKFAVEQLVNYGLSEGMHKEEFTVLFINVLGEEGYAAFSAGQPPEREVIDDLRSRVYVIVHLASPDEVSPETCPAGQ